MLTHATCCRQNVEKLHRMNTLLKYDLLYVRIIVALKFPARLQSSTHIYINLHVLLESSGILVQTTVRLSYTVFW
jgi:hypothetical protein